MSSLAEQKGNLLIFKTISALERFAQIQRVLTMQRAHLCNLSPLQAHIITYLREQPARRRHLTALARHIGVSKATLSDSLRVLEERKLIHRTTDEPDRRKEILSLTSTGFQTSAMLQGCLTPIEASLKKLPTSVLENMLLGLLHLIDDLYQAGIIRESRMCFSCRHFERHVDRYYCKLLKKKLEIQNLQVDCSDHVLA